jgi:hypothetical protein
MKTRIEEAAREAYINHELRGDVGKFTGINNLFFEGVSKYFHNDGFTAGAEFMQKELEREWDLICQGWHFELEAKEDKLKIAVEALELIAEEYYGSSISMNEARMALEKIKGEK